MLPGKMRGEGSRLRAALVIERDIGLPLETPLGVPCRAPMPDANQFFDSA
jgi:hypothetical protein